MCVRNEIGALEARNAALERAIKHVCRANCRLRLPLGLCDRDCPARDYCDTEGLTLWRRESLAELLRRPKKVCLGNAGDVY